MILYVFQLKLWNVWPQFQTIDNSHTIVDKTIIDFNQLDKCFYGLTNSINVWRLLIGNKLG